MLSFLSGPLLGDLRASWIRAGDDEIACNVDVFRVSVGVSLSSTLLCLRIRSGVYLVRFAVPTWFRAGDDEIARESDVFWLAGERFSLSSIVLRLSSSWCICRVWCSDLMFTGLGFSSVQSYQSRVFGGFLICRLSNVVLVVSIGERYLSR